MKSYIYKLPQQSQKKNFLFNMMGSLTNAIVSMMLLVVVSYIVGVSDAGVFSVAFSTAQMINAICVFEMRNIQVTDANREFSFSNVTAFRLITILAAWTFFVGFAIMRGYHGETLYVMIALIAYMSLLSVSDLFQGNMHLNGYLSLAGKSLTCEIVMAATAFIITLLITKNLLFSVTAMIAIVVAWIFLFDIPVSNNFAKFKPKFNFTAIKKMFLCAVPLFLSTFSHQYIFNSPKYAIEETLSRADQAHYGYLVMPVFAINLLSIFIFRPQLISLSSDWANGKIQSFKKTVVKLYLWVAAVTVAALVGGYLLGIPVLELLYNAELSSKKSIFMVLLVSGGFSAASTLTLTLFTTMRKQKLCLIAYGVTIIFALIMPNIMTVKWGLMGAALSYLCEMALLFVIMFVMFLFNVRRKKDE